MMKASGTQTSLSSPGLTGRSSTPRRFRTIPMPVITGRPAFAGHDE
jgi:hypothetical protein